MITLICPDCGGAIVHECGAIVGANVAQSNGAIRRNPEPDARIAHGSKGLDLELSPKRARVYNQGYDQGFLEFWTVYPRKRDKRKALLAWRKSVERLGANLNGGVAQITGAIRVEAMAQILAGAARYRDDPNRIEQFTKYAEGWLNGDGWEDEPLPPRQPSLGWLDETYRRATNG